MIALKIDVPIASLRKGFAREYWETEVVPPPSTCYGMLLSMVGEVDRRRHLGVRVCPALQCTPEVSTVYRTLWRVKDPRASQGTGANTRPGVQEILTGLKFVLWVDSSGETGGGRTLEDRIHESLDHPERVVRFGGLCLGESTGLVNEVSRLRPTESSKVRAFLLSDRGRLSLPVWVDHVSSGGTRYVCGELVEFEVQEKMEVDRMPRIDQIPE